jgi:PAS domain S-box-containing protein
MHESAKALTTRRGMGAISLEACGHVPPRRPGPVNDRPTANGFRAEDRFRLLVEAVKDYAIFMLDPEGRVATWNPGAERIKGYTADEIVGQPTARFYDPEDVAAGKPRALLEEAVRSGRTEAEGWRVRRDGSRFWAHVVVTPVRDAAGALLGFAKVTRDLTLHRELEEERIRRAQAEEAIRLRDEFLAIASHELRTPLTVMQLQLGALRERFEHADERTAGQICRAARNAERLAALVETLLDTSRIASGRLETSPEPLELGEVARDVADRLADSAAAARCELRVEADGEVRGRWDRLRIEQLLTNLVVNALRHGAGAPVVVSVSGEGGEAVLAVRDRGPGIEPRDLARIFGRFERASPIRHFGGLGLGLYAARQIAEAHGGTVSAENAPDGGARFTVRLPAA